MLVVRFAVKDAALTKFWEPTFHVTCIGVPLMLCIWALVTESFNPIGSQPACWVNPHECDDQSDESCEERGEEWGWFLYEVSNIVIYAAVAILLLTNLVIYFHVRKIENRGRRFVFAAQNAASSDSQESSGARRQPTSRASKVATQSFLFLGGFILTYLFAFVSGFTAEYVGTTWFYVIIVLENVFLPMQG